MFYGFKALESSMFKALESYKAQSAFVSVMSVSTNQ